MALDGRVVGLVAARDAVRPEAHDVIHDLKHLKITEIALLTGDRASAAAAVARKTHIKIVAAEQLPADKARWIEERQAAGRRVAMVGDGINDAPALARAHAGIALGGIGADLAAEAGDLVILGEPLSVLPDLVKLSRTTVAVIRQNIIGFAFGLNAVAMASAALGWLGPVAAAILHQAGSLFVLLNAMRLLAFGDWASLGPGPGREEPGRGDRAAGRPPRSRPGRRRPAPVLAGPARSRRARRLDRLRDQRVDGDRTRPGGTLATARTLSRRPRAGAAPLLASPVRHGHAAGPRAGAEPGNRLPHRAGRGGDADPVRWETAHGRDVVGLAEDESLLLTGDGQLVELSATAQYRLDAARPEALRAYAFATADADRALRPLAESAVRDVAARRPLDALLTASAARGRACRRPLAPGAGRARTDSG